MAVVFFFNKKNDIFLIGVCYSNVKQLVLCLQLIDSKTTRPIWPKY